MQLDGIGTSAEEGVSGLEWVDDFQCVKEVAELCIGSHLHVPVAFPHDFNVIPSLSQGLLFVEGGLVDFLEGAIRVTDSVAVNGEAFETPVPKTSVEFVYGETLSDGIARVEPVHLVPVQQVHLASVSNGADAIARGRVLLT